MESIYSSSIIFLALILIISTAVAAEGPAVMITNYEVNPEVFMPGDTGTISVTIENMDVGSTKTETTSTTSIISSSSTTTTSTISAEIESIRVISREIEWSDEYYKVGALGPGKSIRISIPIEAKALRDGTYFPEIYIEVDNGKNVRFPIPIKVDSSEVEIFEKDVPSEISISESKDIEISVVNNRPNSVSGVNVRMKHGSGLEFIPDRIFIGNMNPFEKKDVNFTLIPLEPGKKNFIFEVTYRNGDNLHYNQLESSISVKSFQDVRIILVNAPRSVFKGEKARIDFDVANGMTKDVKGVSVIPEDRIRILPSEYFIGDMEAGDVFSASFDIDTTDLDEGIHKVSFKLRFRDEETDRIYEIPGYEVEIGVKGQQKEETNWLFFVLPPALLIPAIVFLWMRIRKRE